MKMPKSDIPNAQNERKKRLADALRQNLQLRKARVRSADANEAPSATLEKAPQARSKADEA